LEHKVGVSGNAVILAVQAAVNPTFHQIAIADLLAVAVEEPFYSQLRTEQQTGYIVHNGVSRLRDHVFLTFSVQSSTHDPRDLLARFELFLEGFLREAMAPSFKERFEVLKKGDLETKKNPFLNLQAEADHYDYAAFERNLDFSRKAKVCGSWF